MTTMAEIKEKPILFKSEMVRAIIQGRKSMTRRIIKPQPKHRPVLTDEGWFDADCINPGIPMKCPYKIGQRIWVKEAWSVHENLDRFTPLKVLNYIESKNDVRYLASEVQSGRYRHSMFMPRDLCRLFIKVADVRAERLQDISEEDAEAEGVTGLEVLSDCMPDHAKILFKRLWESINGKGSWERNDWVWVVQFKRIKP